jgi:hypothetical protein
MIRALILVPALMLTLVTATASQPVCDVPTNAPAWDYTPACNPDVAAFIEGEQ